MNPTDAERAVLGGMILSPQARTEAMTIVKADDFIEATHCVVFALIAELHAAASPVDQVVLNREASARGLAINPAYVFELADAVPTVAVDSVRYYARAVSDAATLRRVVQAGDKIAALGRSGRDPREVLQEVAELVDQLQPDANEDDELLHISTVFERVVDRLESPEDKTGLVPIPYKDLEHVIPGIKPGEMMIVGARPGVGKSITAADIARHAAMKRGIGTAFFSLEMTHIELGNRIAAAESSVSMTRFGAREQMSDTDWERVRKVKDRFDQAPFWMSDNFQINVAKIRAHLTHLTRKHDIGLVIVDYLQLMEGERADSRQAEVSKLSRGLKKLAGEFGVALVVLSQLNRNPAGRQGGKPKLSDLRESGAIEQDADMVIMLHRDDPNDTPTPRLGEIDLLVEKNRHGPDKVEVTCAFQGHYSRVMDMA